MAEERRVSDGLKCEVSSLSAQVNCLEAQLADARERAQQDRLQLNDVLRTARLDAKSDNALQQLNDQLKSLKQQVKNSNSFTASISTCMHQIKLV